MPFDGSGVFYPPNPPVYPAVTGQTIKASYFNQVIDDLTDGLTNCITKDGQTVVTAPLTFANVTLNALTAASVAAGSMTAGGSPVLTARYETGEVVKSFNSIAPAGTVPLLGGTIGNAASGATARANADTAALFALLWGATSNAAYPIQDSSGSATTRGASAAADFAANKRFPLPNVADGEALVASVSSTLLSSTAGEGLAHSHTINDPGHSHTYNGTNVTIDISADNLTRWVGQSGQGLTTSSATTGITVNSSGGSKNKAAGLFVKFYVAL
jgi:hypothetical protein